MASGNDQTIHEIFSDNDSENEDEFEGFDPEDIYRYRGRLKKKN
jgi:hypothetical protein